MCSPKSEMDINGNKTAFSDSRPKYVIDYDEYGFAVFEKDYNPDGERCHQYSKLNEDAQLAAQWRKVMEQPDWKAMHGCPSIKIQKLLRQGVPSTVRSAVWTKLLDATTLRNSSSFNYKAQLGGVREQLVDIGVSEYGGKDAVMFLCELESSGVTPMEGHITFDILRQIMLDLDRSFPTHKMFIQGRPEGIEGRAALFRILATYARYNKHVGYCQGMSYLGGLMLMVMEDEDSAFWGLVSLLERFKYLRGYYDKHMERIQRHVVVFQKLIKQRLPQISSHMDLHGVSSMMFATPWFLSLYTGLPCWESVLSIWDLFMLDGAVTMFRVGLGLLDVMRDTILGCEDISSLLPHLLHPPHDRVGFLSLMPAVFDVYLEDWEVAQLEAVVMEETGVSSRSARRHAPTHPAGTDTTDMDQPQEKRRRLNTDSVAPATQPSGSSSLLKRFVNIFHPQEPRAPAAVGRGRAAGEAAGRGRVAGEAAGRGRAAGEAAGKGRATGEAAGQGRAAGWVATTPSTPRQRDACRRGHTQPTHPQQTISEQTLAGLRSSYGHIYTDYPAMERSRNRLDNRPPRTSTPKRKFSEKRPTETDENDASRLRLRRSPRLRKTILRNLNSPSKRKLVGSGAEVQLSFKEFKASKPLRRSQRKNQANEVTPRGANNDAVMSSPVELKSLLCKTQ